MQVTNVTQQKLGWRLNELSKVYGLSISFLRKEIRAGRLPAKKVGAVVLVLDEDFRKYLDREQAS